MNQLNAIKGLIPERLFKIVPSAKREDWAGRIVVKFEENEPKLYAAIGQWDIVPDDERERIVRAILTAAEQIHKENRNEG